MMDNISKEERHRVMASVKQKNTRPELKVRYFLHSQGLRYRLHDRFLPGKPDIILPKYRTIIFVNGCFWHGHEDDNCKLARTPKSNVGFWLKKVNDNKSRDSANIKKLTALGWWVILVWECYLSEKNYLDDLVVFIKTRCTDKESLLEIYHHAI